MSTRTKKIIVSACILVYFYASLTYVTNKYHNPDYNVWLTLINIVLGTIVYLLFFPPKRKKENK